ncbi:MAG: PKD domain-containing protein, partial [Methanoregula sp.]
MTPTPHNEKAAAEMVGALILISIFCVIIAIVAVSVLSTPPPEKIPTLNMKFVSEGTNTVKIFHEGGDAIPTGQYKVMIDNIDVTPYIVNPPSDSWEIGDSLDVTVPWMVSPDSYVQVVYESGGTSAYLLATNGTATGNVSASPVTADFYGIPTSGIKPLPVQFTDTSTGPVTSWYWTFGDGNTSSVRNPLYTYPNAGTYTVSLMVGNGSGFNTRTRTDYITVSNPASIDILLNAAKPGYLVSGGTMQFRVTGAWSFITHGATTYNLNINDIVQLVIGSDLTGKIDATDTTINTFAFDDVHLYINGVDKGTGTIPLTGGIWISGYDQFSSSLSVDVPWQNAWTQFRVNGVNLIYGDDNSRIQVYNLKPSANVLNFDNLVPTSTYYLGGATGYLITPMPLPLAANFSASPLMGVKPLPVQFTDASTGGVTSWNWTFGDGNTSVAQNPLYVYPDAGNYTVSLTVSNGTGFSTLTRTNYITVVTPGLPVRANFNGTPLTGVSPLPVQFTDASTGGIISWNWTFGDGNTSTVQNPLFTYISAGNYTVSLTVGNGTGSDTLTRTDYILVTVPPSKKAIVLNAGKPGILNSGGVMQFRVTGAWSSIVHGVSTYNLNVNDVVQLVVGSDPTGQIDATGSTISSFSFDDIHLYINGVDEGTGTISSIWISGYDQFSSTLSVDVPWYDAGTFFSVDGETLIDWWPTNASRIQVFNLCPSDAGTMSFNSAVANHIEFTGGATNYLITPPPSAPVVDFSGTPLSGTRPLTVRFTDNSTNSPISWLWSFGDGDSTNATVQSPVHQYASAGTYSVTLNATNAGGSGILTRTNYITVNPPPTYIITASAIPPGGSISPSGAVSVEVGNNQSFTVNADTGYHIADVVVDGVSNGTISSYTFTNVVVNHTITASFAINTYTITASAGANGAISPAGVTTVNYGATPTYTITPDVGYHVVDVTVNGTSVGAVTSYVFPAVTTNKTIAATFAINTYTITASPGANGVISPAGVTTVNYGATPMYTITPNVGYHVVDVTVNGTSVGAVTSYVFPAVTTNKTIAATFAINQYTITASPGANGAISPAGVTTVNYGATPTYTITPDVGYHVVDVTVNGTSVGAVTSYVFPAVTTNKTIAATFAINTYTITASPGANGAITPAGVTTVNYGATPTYTITPNVGYHVVDVTVNGTSVGAVTSYVFPAVTTNKTIAATFAINTY